MDTRANFAECRSGTNWFTINRIQSRLPEMAPVAQTLVMLVRVVQYIYANPS